MSKEGYLQLKIRELNEKMEELEDRITKSSNKFEEINKNISNNIDNASKDFAPLFELNDKIQGLHNILINQVESKINQTLNEFDQAMLHKIIASADTIKKVNQNSLNQIVKQLREEVNKNNNLLTRRFDNLVEILNKRGITEITQLRINLNDKKMKIIGPKLKRKGYVNPNQVEKILKDIHKETEEKK